MQLLAFVLGLMIAAAFIPLLSDSMQAHAASFGVSKSKVTVKTDHPVTVKVTGLSKSKAKKVKWSTSDEAIAKVDPEEGASTQIVGVTSGKATISAKYKGTTKKIKVTVKIDNPAVTGVDNGEKYSNYQAEGTVYALLYQESAEVAALQMQAFNLAKIRADEAIEANGGTGEGLAIVTDIDSTIADDTCYVAGAVLDSAARISLGLQPWNNDDWDGYYQAVATDADTVIPGAKEFVDYTYSKGIEWYYITNRPYYELDLTVKQLNKQGFFDKYAKRQDLLDTYKIVEGYQDYYYYADTRLAEADADGWYDVYSEGTYGKKINDTGVLEMASQSFSVKDDYRVQVQGSDFDSDKAGRRANVAKVAGKDKIIMYLGDSINDMVSDYEKDVWGDHAKDFTRKQFNDTRTANASSDYWKDHWGNDFIVLPNATYGDWYKTTWAKGKDPEKRHDSSTREGQQQYIYDQIWSHSYKNPKFPTWYNGPSPTGPMIQ